MEMQMESTNISSPAPINFLRYRRNPTIAFGVGILLFLLPFAQIRCGQVVLARNSGVGLAVGASWSISKIEWGKSGMANGETPLNTPPNWFLLMALVCAGGGIIVSLIPFRDRFLYCMSAGLLCIALMIGGWIYLRSITAPVTPGPFDKNRLEQGLSGAIKIEFTPWFYISLLAFGLGAFFGYKLFFVEMEEKAATLHDFEFQDTK